MNPARIALTRAVNAAIAAGAPVFVNVPAPVFKVYRSSVREVGPRDRNGASSFVIGEQETCVFEGDKAGAIAALRAIPIGASVAVRYPGGLRSCMNKPALLPWLEAMPD